MRRSIVLSLFVSLSLWSAPARALDFTYATINFPGASTTLVGGISEAGLMVGNYTDSSGSYGFVTNDGVNFTTVNLPNGSPPGYGFGFADINDNGQMVGSYQPPSLVTNSEKGFVATEGSYSTLAFPGSRETRAQSINDAGQIVGIYEKSTGTYGFYTANGTSFQSMSAFGSTFTRAIGINNAGEIVGSFSDATGGHGFLTSDRINYIAFNVPGGTTTWATGINGSGQIIGDFSDGTGGLRGFFTSDRITYDILMVPDSFSTHLLGIDNHGNIVGQYLDSTGYHGFIASPVPLPAALPLFGTGLGLVYLTSKVSRAFAKRKQETI